MYLWLSLVQAGSEAWKEELICGGGAAAAAEKWNERLSMNQKGNSVL